jgi:PIN domain nuclease of toxin-antitoxin system
MKLLLDTHTFLWAGGGPENLSPKVRSLLDSFPAHEIFVSSMSIREISMLVKKQKIGLSEPVPQWLNRVLKQSGIRIIDVSAEIAMESCFLPGEFHSDPADQMIVATARLESAILLTKDQKILAYPHVNAQW